MKHLIATPDELVPGARKLVRIGAREIGVFNVNGHIKAVLNVCPHELAPVCLGRVRGTAAASAPGQFVWAREGEILCCPWHGWEFDLNNGHCLTDARRLKVYAVTQDDAGYWLSEPL
jgi:nitrite reductase (NADH) small subunit